MKTGWGTSPGRSAHEASYARAIPVFRYSPLRYRLIIALGLLVFGGAVALGVTAAVVGLVLVALFALGVKDRLRGGGVALAREGDVLIGGELRRPLPVAGTTFAIEAVNEGTWIIVLRGSEGKAVRLSPGGWALEGERFVTKPVAERALLGMGLSRQN